MRSATLRWIGLALLGIVVAAGVAVAASSLVSHQIGLASEPLSAGDALAPVAAQRYPAKRSRERAAPARPFRPTAPPTESTSPPPVETEPSGAEEDGGDSGGGPDD